MSGRFGEITFRADIPEGEPINHYLDLRAAPWYDQCATTVTLGDPRRSEVRRLGATAFARSGCFVVRGSVGEHGVCMVTLEVEGDWTMPEHESRDFVIGLAALGFARPSNLEARADLHEAFTFSVASLPLA
jgi:hypothetical protein